MATSQEELPAVTEVLAIDSVRETILVEEQLPDSPRLTDTLQHADSLELLAATQRPDSLQLPDSLPHPLQADSLAIDSLTVAPTDTTLSLDAARDSIEIDIPKEKLDFTVHYTAQDSVIFTADNMGFLYGDADIEYGEMSIKGEYITVDLDSSMISSTFGVDSLGKEFGYPVFKEGPRRVRNEEGAVQHRNGKSVYSRCDHEAG